MSPRELTPEELRNRLAYYELRLSNQAEIIEQLAGGKAPVAPEGADGPRVERLDVVSILAAPPPPIRHLWHGYLERGTLAVLHGFGGLGKSMIGGGLARAVCSGSPFLGQRTERGGVLIVDAENPRDEIARRMHALDFPEQGITYLRAFEALLSRDDAADWLSEEIRQADARLVILDSQRALSKGDEKEQRDMRELYSLLRYSVVEETDACAVVLHHDNKGREFSGSTDIDASVDTRMHLKRPDGAESDDRRINLVHAKARSSAPQATIGVDLAFDKGRAYITPVAPARSERSRFSNELASHSRSQTPCPSRGRRTGTNSP